VGAVLEILPFLTWIAALTSAALLVVSGMFGDLRRTSLAALVGWSLAAGYAQFFGGSPVVRAVGLALQTLLAVGLLLRYRSDSPRQGRSR